MPNDGIVSRKWHHGGTNISAGASEFYISSTAASDPNSNKSQLTLVEPKEIQHVAV